MTPKCNTHLSPSKFLIGTEPKWLSLSHGYQSTFKNDYPPKHCLKTEISERPLPAGIMHKDDRINYSFSVTHDSFSNQKHTEKSKACNSLTKTNFKMETDARIETFQTTHNRYYQANTASKPENNKHDFSNRMESHIPQGDKKKECFPKSDYRSNFTESKIPPRLNIINDTFLSEQPTIKGDERSHAGNDIFNTTSRKMFPLFEVNKKAEVPYNVKYPSTKIPCGDEKQFESTQQASFKHTLPPLKGTSFQRTKALEALQKTAFRNGDNRLSIYNTTTGESFKRPTVLVNPHVKQNSSRLSSVNVCYKEPVFQQIGCTVNMSDYKPKSCQNKIVDGSKLRTVSKVTFGDDRQLYYDTTTDSCFKRQNINSFVKPEVDTYTSSVPLKSVDRMIPQSSYRTDFVKSDSKRLVPNPIAIDNLVKSHIRLPLENYREFRTTNRETYTRKSKEANDYIDTGRLQKSSLPLGTMVH